MGFQDRGAIMTGYQADFILLDDVPSFKIATVYKNGKQVSTAHPDMYFPESFYQSVQCRPLTKADLSFKVEKAMTCNVIAIQKVGTFTEHVQRTVAEKDGFLDWENSGLALIVVMERYGKNGNIGYGFVENALNEKGAIATTWAHDHHNVMIMGTSIADILAAQHAVLDMQGGYVVSVDGVIAASCPLPIGGILSDEPVPVLGKKLGEVRREMQRLGYKNTNEIMSFSTLSLPVSPKLKITDFGMMDVHTHELIPLMER
jgi:adenine deaminase